MNDILIDFETFGSTSNAAVIDVSLIAFDPDPTKIQSLDELISNGLRVKFDLSSQKGQRLFSKSTLSWWKEQSVEARKNLAPTPDDKSTIEGTNIVLDWIRRQDIDPWNSQMWCRGMSFDFPIFTDLIRGLYRHEGVPENEIDTFKLEPVKFWNQRDVRTAIEAYSMVRGMSMTPLPAGTLKGFVAHDSLHDCAKDILMLQYAKRYALGLDECPTEADADPLSLGKTR